MRLPSLLQTSRQYCSNKLLSLPKLASPASLPHAACSTIATNRRHCRYHHYYHYHHHHHYHRKIVVIMGATGSGKSRLSIDLATRFFPSEIINSDKIQVYRGLNITTNKIPMPDRRGVPHHLLGEVDPSIHPEFTPLHYRSAAADAISGVASRRKLPLLVGGSNSFIYSLLAKRFDPESDVFRPSKPDPVFPELRYNCCFLWVDVAMPVLNQYLDKRVDDMLELGMVEELAEYFALEGFRESDSTGRAGLRKAIGVPEFEPYFRRFGSTMRTEGNNWRRDPVGGSVYEEAIRAIKENTCELAKRQVGKIERLRSGGWDMRRVDATDAFRAAMGLDGSDSARASDIWERIVVEPSVKGVRRFLEE